MERFYLSLVCVGYDILASRKLCGFLGKKIVFRRNFCLPFFLFKLLKKEIFVNESHINLVFLRLGPVPTDSILCL